MSQQRGARGGKPKRKQGYNHQPPTSIPQQQQMNQCPPSMMQPPNVSQQQYIMVPVPVQNPPGPGSSILGQPPMPAPYQGQPPMPAPYQGQQPMPAPYQGHPSMPGLYQGQSQMPGPYQGQQPMTGPYQGQPPMLGQYQGQPPMPGPYQGQPPRSDQSKYPPPLMSLPTAQPGNLNIMEGKNIQSDQFTPDKRTPGKKKGNKPRQPSEDVHTDKQKRGPNKGQRSEQEDDGFQKLKSLLSEEPSGQYREEAGMTRQSENTGGGRRKRRGGRGHRGHGGNNRQESEDEENSSDEENDQENNPGNYFGSQDLCHSDSTNFRGSKSHGLNQDFKMSTESIDSVGSRGYKGNRGRGGRGNQRGRNESRPPRQEIYNKENAQTGDFQGDINRSHLNKERGRGRGGRKGNENSHFKPEDDYELEESTSQGQENLRGRGRGRGRGRRGRGGFDERNNRENNDSPEENISNDDARGKSRRGRGRGQRGGRGKGHEDTDQRNQDEEDETDIPDIDDIEIFKFIIKTFGGGCSFEDFVMKCDLFPLNANIPRWLSKHSRRFHIYRDKGKIVHLIPFYRDAKICSQYNNKKHLGNCDKSDCDFFHVCRRFIRGNCKESGCDLSHSFKTSHNRRLKDRLGIHDFTDADIRIVLNCNSPSLCSDYVYNKGCKVPNFETRCPYLHICRSHIFGKCTDPCKFKLTHSVKQFHNRWVLTSCHMKDWPAARVFRSVYVPPRQTSTSEDDSDDSDFSPNEDDESVCGYDSDTFKCSYFVGADSTESLNSNPEFRHNTKLKETIQSMESLNITGGGRNREPNSSKSKLGRSGRFKSTDNIICGIVGKDDQDLKDLHSAEDLETIPKRRAGSYEEEEIDIKEKERILMEKWKQEQETSSASSSQGNKPPVPVKPKTIKDPTDPSYQVRDQSLLTDEAEKSNICLHVTKEKCPAKSTCKNHHLSTGIPYLWQIKMEGKWLSFSNAESEKIEKGFTDFLEVVDTQMVYNRRRYKFNVYFTNPMFGVKYDVDGNPGEDGHKYVVRRLSTPSFAEKKMTIDCYLTQWRWHFKDDTQMWIKYNKDLLQFTLEKKYITKQKTYLFTRENFNFMYRIDFSAMTQTNLDTYKIRQILRRPLFVSLADVEQKKFPESIPYPAASSTVRPMHFYHWDCSHDFELVELDTKGKEYIDVMKSFTDSMDPTRFNVKYLYRIQNRKLWSEYDTKKKHMLGDAEQDGGRQNVDERDLFHGTDSMNTCRGICTNNFDFRTSGRNATLYGEGSYFADRSKLSHSYTKADSPQEIRFMFRAKVLVGQFTQGNPKLRRPPEIPGQTYKLYDSCVDKVQDPKIFVVFDRNQCYPEYLFMYTDRETVPTVPVEQQLVYPHPTGSQTSPTMQLSYPAMSSNNKQPATVLSPQLRDEHQDKGEKCVIQ